MNFIFLLFLQISILAWGRGAYFDQVCTLGLNDQLVHKQGTVFYYQVETEAKLSEILVMNFKLDVLRDDKVINQIKLLNNYENRAFRRGEIVLMPERVILSEINKRLMVLENCEVVPLAPTTEDQLL